MPSLFDPIHIGPIAAPNRIVMAPLTRARGTKEHVPTPIMASYYAQRASAGLIISEAIGISRQGLGWPFATGLWTDEQTAGWKVVTDAVHAAGGRIMAQLWHMGRIVHPSFRGGELPVSASATTAPGRAHTYEGKQPYVEARPLALEEIAGILADYRTAARNAMAAGFDGVELHAANGYLIDQFLRDGTNLRTDAYGGPIDNRIRLLVEATRAIAETVGPERTGVRLSPNADTQGVSDSNALALFTAAIEALSKLHIAFLELRDPPADGSFGAGNGAPLGGTLRPHFDGVLILNSDFTPERAKAAVADGICDAVSFGRPFIANPDLPRRIQDGLPLAPDVMQTWYSQGPEGYTDYPTAEA